MCLNDQKNQAMSLSVWSPILVPSALGTIHRTFFLLVLLYSVSEQGGAWLPLRVLFSNLLCWISLLY